MRAVAPRGYLLRGVACGIGLLLIACHSAESSEPERSEQALTSSEDAAAAADGGGSEAVRSGKLARDERDPSDDNRSSALRGGAGAAGCTSPGQRLCFGDSVYSCAQDLATAHHELACAGETPNCIDARCVGAICAPTPASNLLRNPDFDVNADAWTAGAGQIAPAWSKTDSTQCTTSGSLRLRARTTVHQCVPIRAGTIQFGGDFLLSPRRREDMPQIELTLYERANCADGSRAYVAASYVAPSETQWLRARSSWSATSAVASAEFSVSVPADAQIDKLFLLVE